MDIHQLFAEVKKHPDFVFGTIFVRGDFPDDDSADDAVLSHFFTDRLVEVGNEMIADQYGTSEDD